jgi:MtN3 and saliva related transmembrane protein
MPKDTISSHADGIKFTGFNSMDNNAIKIIGIIAGVFTAISLLPQLIKMIKNKKAEDISIIYLLTLFCGLSLWVWYGFLREDLPIILTNLTSAALNLVTLFLGLKYKKSKTT